jgi:outer membrane protein TolC
MKNRIEGMDLDVLPRRGRMPVAVAAACLCLAGCAVVPHPITMQERAARLAGDKAAMFRGQEPVTAPLTLADAMARAIKYNLDNRLKLLEEAVSRRQLDLANYDLLPKLTVAAGYAGRDSYAAQSSRDIVTGRQSLVPSTSQDKNRRTADLGFTWNILDFGVSYYQAQQQADRTLIMNERRRKVVHSLMQQVRQAYWFALGAQEMEAKIGPLLKEVQSALDDSRRIEQEKLRAPIETLTYRRQLVDIVRQLEAVRDELAQARPRLAALMNVEPGTDFKLALPPALKEPQLAGTLPAMEKAALLNRPELVEAQYNERIGVLETKKAMAKLLPGIEVSLMERYDTNSFLVDNQWAEVGLRVSWNLLNVFSGPKIIETAEAQEQVAKMQHLALGMAVLSQVHVAYRDFAGRQRQFELSDTLYDLDSKILDQVRNARQSSAQGRLAEIQAETNALFSQLRRYQSYGSLQGAYGTMLTTLGADPVPETVSSYDVAALARSIAVADATTDVKSLLKVADRTKR